MRFEIAIDIMPRGEISDPQGQTIELALPKLGFGSISNVRVGKRMTMTVDAVDEKRAIEEIQNACRKFLANPAIEEFSIEVRQVQEVG